MSLHWNEAYQQELQKLPPDAPLERVAECIFEYGILAHISPVDPKSFAERVEKRKPVWTRSDPTLYWRILYAARGAIESARAHYSLGDAIVTWPVAVACHTYIKQDEGCRGSGEPGDPFLKGALAVASRAEKELRALGETPHCIPIGAKGMYRGLRVQVESYSFYGCVVLRSDDRLTHEERFSVWKRLGALSHNSNMVEPRDLNPADFPSFSPEIGAAQQ